jgi:enoyl-CoA hydratase/carnithine racemase
MVNGFESILFEKRDGISYVTLNRPEYLNAFNLQMRDELYQILKAIKDDSDIKVAIFSGTGEKAFCAGADLHEFLTAPSPIVAREVRRERDVWELFLSVTKPMLAVLHGFVLGSGLEIALCCDIRIASRDAQFGLPETTLGIIPAAGGTQTLSRLIGKANAMEMIFTGRLIGAEEALKLGLVNQAVPRQRLLPVSEELARRITSYKAQALCGAKKAVIRGFDQPLEQGLETEQRIGLMAAISK